MKKIKNILIQFMISFTVLWSVFVWYAAWNDVVNDGDSLTFTMWNDLVTQVWTITSSPVLKWYINWFTLSNDWWDLNNDIQIEVWTATSKDWLQYIDLNTVLTKRLDAGWTVWDNWWWLATGSKASSTWYHVFVIWKSDGSVDAWFDTSLTATNLLSTSGYNKYRRVGSVKTNGSSNILGFLQEGDYFIYKNPVLDVSTSGSWYMGGTLQAISAPLGIRTLALLAVGDNGDNTTYITSPEQNNNAASLATGMFTNYSNENNGSDNNQGGVWFLPPRTNTSSQVRIRTSGTQNIYIATHGWIDNRVQ